METLEPTAGKHGVSKPSLQTKRVTKKQNHEIVKSAISIDRASETGASITSVNRSSQMTKVAPLETPAPFESVPPLKPFQDVSGKSKESECPNLEADGVVADAICSAEKGASGDGDKIATKEDLKQDLDSRKLVCDEIQNSEQSKAKTKKKVNAATYKESKLESIQPREKEMEFLTPTIPPCSSSAVKENTISLRPVEDSYIRKNDKASGKETLFSKVKDHTSKSNTAESKSEEISGIADAATEGAQSLPEKEGDEYSGKSNIVKSHPKTKKIGRDENSMDFKEDESKEYTRKGIDKNKHTLPEDEESDASKGLSNQKKNGKPAVPPKVDISKGHGSASASDQGYIDAEDHNALNSPERGSNKKRGCRRKGRKKGKKAAIENLQSKVAKAENQAFPKSSPEANGTPKRQPRQSRQDSDRSISTKTFGSNDSDEGSFTFSPRFSPSFQPGRAPIRPPPGLAPPPGFENKDSKDTLGESLSLDSQPLEIPDVSLPNGNSNEADSSLLANVLDKKNALSLSPMPEDMKKREASIGSPIKKREASIGSPNHDLNVMNFLNFLDEIPVEDGQAQHPEDDDRVQAPATTDEPTYEPLPLYRSLGVVNNNPWSEQSQTPRALSYGFGVENQGEGAEESNDAFVDQFLLTPAFILGNTTNSERDEDAGESGKFDADAFFSDLLE